MSSSTCKTTRIQSSFMSLQAILEDLKQNYDQVGGEISDIRLASTDHYIVSISQEERIDKIDYKIKAGEGCNVTIVSKAVSAETPWDQ